MRTTAANRNEMAALMKTAPVAAGLLTMILALPCCDSKTCTAEARSSVRVLVVDAAGTLVRGANVRYVANDDVERDAICIPNESVCDEWVAGYEISGTILVKATSADGLLHAERTVTVKETEDGCHVQTEQITLQLR